MKITNYIIILFSFSLLVLSGCSSQGNEKKLSRQAENEQIQVLEVVVPGIQDEATSIWRTINDLEFLESQGYQISLPNHWGIDSLKAKSRAGGFGNEDYPQIVEMLENGQYDVKDYEIALDKVNAEKDLIEEIITTIKEKKDGWDWEFKVFQPYKAVFTIYGTGGSYDPDLGKVTLFTTRKGDFKRYESPAYTIIHEIVHMGLEESIVQKYQLSHGDKERLVDRFVYIHFRELLPGYKIQNMGNPRLDDLLSTPEDFVSLDGIMEEYSRSSEEE